MSDLSNFEDAFCDALGGRPLALSPWEAELAPGLTVYRNTILKGAVDAVVASHPTLELMVGEPWLRAAATAYARTNPPASPTLHTYGSGFAAWLETFPAATDTPYLAAMAQLDSLWWSSYFAADQVPLGAEAFVGKSAGDLSVTAARLHPSVRLAAFNHNLASLWLSHQPPGPPAADFTVVSSPEWLLICRPVLEVRATILDTASHAFLSACADGASLLAAAERALAADADAQFTEIIATSLELGVFACLDEAIQGSPS